MPRNISKATLELQLKHAEDLILLAQKDLEEEKAQNLPFIMYVLSQHFAALNTWMEEQHQEASNGG